jgi:hypothetical protein
VVANGRGRSPQASEDCVISCVRQLQQIKATGKIVLDRGYLILLEYQAQLRSEGQPSEGDAFLKWALTNQANPQRCDRVRINPTEDRNSFAEFPDDPDLKDFDRSDRKFVAAACAHPDSPAILNAVDTDWWLFRAALERNGVHVNFLCPRDVKGFARTRQLNK